MRKLCRSLSFRSPTRVCVRYGARSGIFSIQSPDASFRAVHAHTAAKYVQAGLFLPVWWRRPSIILCRRRNNSFFGRVRTCDRRHHFRTGKPVRTKKISVIRTNVKRTR